MIRLALVLVLAALAVAGAGGVTGPGSARAAEDSPQSGRPVFLVPLGNFPRTDAVSLARHLGRSLDVSVSVLPPSALPRSAFDRLRKQYVAEEVIDLLPGRRPAGNAPAVLIGLTTEDLYTRHTPSWRFTFSIRSLLGYAVVSRARMDPRLQGLQPDPALRMRRLRKMVLKSVGVLALGFSQSRNPRSVLYDSVLGTDDLDYMTEEFRPHAPSRQRRNWLGRSTSVCERGIVEAKALIARSTIATPADFLAFARESIALAERHRRQLAALKPSAEDRAAVRSLLGLFKRSSEADRATVAKLSEHWSEATFTRSLQESLRNSLALKSAALELGSLGCSRYFDPATYR